MYKNCLKKLLLAGTVAAFSVSQCFAWTIKITTGGMTYEGAPLGNEVVYRSKGKIIGSSRVLGNEIEYRDGKGLIVGSVRKIGNEWSFRDGRGKIIGSAVKLGNVLTYKNGGGTVIGTSVLSGSNTEYRNNSNLPIGKADTDTMPLRPIPLEKALSASTSSLTLVEGLDLTMAAAKAGLRAGDIIIGYEGVKQTTLDQADPDPKVMQLSSASLIRKYENKADVALVFYRPAPDEKNTARGKVYKTGPLPAGKRGFRYRTFASYGSFTAAGSAEYVAQIRKLYEAGNFEVPPISLPDENSAQKDPRTVSGATQEFREEMVNGKAEIGWFWIDNSSRKLLNAQQVDKRAQQ